jgi:hypothetical protein
MKTLLAALTFAAVALPGAAYAADGEMEKCCCEKMKHEGKDCCEDKAPAAPEADHPAHGEHQPAPAAD